MSLNTSLQDAFILTWEIENLSYCMEEYMDSAEFTYMEVKYTLRLYPKGYSENSSMSVVLRKCSSNREDDTVYFSISVTDSDDFINVGKHVMSFQFTEELYLSNAFNFIKRRDIDSKKLLIVPNDVLTLQCVIKKPREGIKDIKEQIMRTRFNVEEVCLDWRMEFFSRIPSKTLSSLPIPVPFDKGPRLSLELSVNREADSRAWVNINLTKHSNFVKRYNSCFPLSLNGGVNTSLLQDCALMVKCSISVLYSRGGRRPLVECESLFEIKNETESLPLPFLPEGSDSLAEEDLLLQNDALNLEVKVKISDGSKITFSNELERKNSRKRKFDQFSTSEKVGEALFKDAKFCDVTLRIQNEDIRAHKAIICSQSPVFHKMFDRDMTEKTNGVVEITDIDLGIVERLITYMYTRQLGGNLDFATAANLYSAAHKYQVLSLVECCSSLMCSGITFENVWDVLPFATKYEDDVLLKAAEDFICNSPRQCLQAKRW